MRRVAAHRGAIQTGALQGRGDHGETGTVWRLPCRLVSECTERSRFQHLSAGGDDSRHARLLFDEG